MRTTKANPPPGAPPTGPSSGVRMVVSFLLVVHLFALGVAVAGTAAEPLWAGVTLQRTLFGPYLRTLGLNTGLRIAHTHGTELDTGWRVLGEARLNDGTTWTHQLVGDDMAPPLRRWRYYRLAEALGGATLDASVDAAQQAILARGLANGMLAELERAGYSRDALVNSQMELVLEQRLLPFPEQARRGQTGETVRPYIADIVVLADELLVNRRDAAREVAPAARD